MNDSGAVTRQQRRAEERRARKRAMKVAAGAAVAMGASMLAGEANAATIVVNSTADNLTASDGQCTLREAIRNANDNAATSPDCVAGEGLPVVDLIQFEAGLTGTIILDPNVEGPYSGQLAIRESVTIEGPGREVLTISGANSTRLFYVYSASGTPGDVTLSGLTMSNGVPLCGESGCTAAGGGILATNVNLTLTDVTVARNSVFGVAPALIPLPGGEGPPFGGGVAKLGPGALVISGSTVTENSALVGGGIYVANDSGAAHVLDNVVLSENIALFAGAGIGLGISDGSTVTIRNSVITGNDTGFGGFPYGPGVSEPPPGYFYGVGGGIVVNRYSGYYSPTTQAQARRARAKTSGVAGPDSSALIIEDTTISGNTSGYGGGLYAGYGGGVTVRRSTISANSAQQSGGGVFAEDSNKVFIINSTVAENTAGFAGGGLSFEYTPFEITETTISGNTAQAGAGAGVFVYNYVGTDLIENSIVANGQAPDVTSVSALTDADIVVVSGTVNVNYSLVETPGADPGWVDLGTNVVGEDPQLGLLQDNGGLTFTMRPAQTSPVIDAGDPAFAPPPATDQRGFPRVTGSAIDMGSVELNGGTIQLSTTAASVSEGAGFVTITATRVGGSEGDVTAPFTTSPGTATATADYDPTGGTFVWADGDATPKSVNIPIVDDAFSEAPETFTVTLGAPTGPALLGTPNAETVTILDNEFGTLAFESATYTTAEGTVSTITVIRSGGTTGPVSVQVAVTGGTATSDADYTFVGTTLTWADGEAGAKTFTIPALTDDAVEAAETVNLALQTPTGGAVVGAQSTTVLTITDVPPVEPVAEVPTLGFMMKLLLILGAGATGVIVLGRGRLLVYLLALCLAMATAPQLKAEQLAKKPRQVRPRADVDTAAATVQAFSRTKDRVRIRIGGETFDVPRASFRMRDMRKGSRYQPRVQLKAGTAVVVKVRRNRDGSAKRIRVIVFDSMDMAKAAVQKQKAER